MSEEEVLVHVAPANSIDCTVGDLRDMGMEDKLLVPHDLQNSGVLHLTAEDRLSYGPAVIVGSEGWLLRTVTLTLEGSEERMSFVAIYGQNRTSGHNSWGMRAQPVSEQRILEAWTIIRRAIAVGMAWSIDESNHHPVFILVRNGSDIEWRRILY
jgi:hypothetical protein